MAGEKTYKCPECGTEHVFSDPGVVKISASYSPCWDEVRPGGDIRCLMCGAKMGVNSDLLNTIKYLYTKNKEE